MPGAARDYSPRNARITFAADTGNLRGVDRCKRFRTCWRPTRCAFKSSDFLPSIAIAMPTDILAQQSTNGL
jgi:hypothetical protein